MNEIDAAKAYEYLLSALEELELEWVVSQIREYVQAGKLVDIKDVDERRRRPEALQLEVTPSYRRPKRGLTTEQYSPQECLHIALKAVEAIAIQTTELETHLSDFFGLE